MRSQILEILNPDNLKIDDRKVEDLIIFALDLSKKINFYNSKNKKEGYWNSLIELDDTFLIAEILQFDLLFYDQKRLNIIQELDNFSSQKDKEIFFSELFNLISNYFQSINRWYISATRNITSVESSPIEQELEQAINNKLRAAFHVFAGYHQGLVKQKKYQFNLQLDSELYHSIWRLDQIEASDIFSDIDQQQDPLSSGLKKLILLYNPVYNILYTIQSSAKPLFEKSLKGRSIHKAHMGLILSFFNLFKSVQDDINSLSKKHLDYYYKNILMQYPKEVTPKKMFVHFDINQKLKIVNLPADAKVKVGQYDTGNNILYSTDNEINLNNIKIANLSTFFISKSNRFEYNSSFKLVSGLFSKTHCKTNSEVLEFNQNENVFSSLGEEQFLKTVAHQTMDTARVGFAISSPILKLAQSERELQFKIQFTPNALKSLTNLIIDISNHRNLSEEDIFSEIFDRMFNIRFTNEEGWIPVSDYSVLYPEDWSEGEISVKIILDRRMPSVDNYQATSHQNNYNTPFPVFEFTLNEGEFYHAYSFLAGMELTKIEIDVSVKGLNKLTALNKQGYVDLDNEFELLGASPKKGATLFIGSNELFCKPLNSLNIKWNYKNFPPESIDLEEYYKNYNREIKNHSFKLKLSALSDFTFKRAGSKDIGFEMFQLNDEAQINENFELKDIDLTALKLTPKYDLDFEAIESYSKELETGFLKLELTDPKIGFGFDVFTPIYNEAVLKATTKKKGEEILPPNQPWAPVVDSLSLDYTSSSTLYFNQSLLSENDHEQQNSFFLLSNQGTRKTFSNKEVLSSFLIPTFDFAGEFIIGLENITPPQSLNLLIEVKKSENTGYEFSQKLDWYYASANGWKKIKASQILYDETLSLMKSGVISLSLPQDMSNGFEYFNDNKFYIKAVSKNKADQFSLIKAVHTNGLSLTEIVSSESEIEASTPIEPNSVQELDTPVSGIIKINQPMSSFGGAQKENDLKYYNRVSQMLRHKNRPITKWDIEKFLLKEFDWLLDVKCISENLDEDLSERQLKILCLKKIDSTQNIDEIKLNGADVVEIKKVLKQYSSPFLNVEIINPIFEDLLIKCKIKFTNISGGKAIGQLNKDFFRFICPWIDGKGEIRNLFKKSEIVQFIKTRPYVSYVTGLSIIHFKTLPDGNVVAYDSASENEEKELIQPGSPWSIFVPRNNNKIEIVDKAEYYPPKPIDYAELNIEGNFIINSKDSSAALDFEPETTPDETQNSKNLSVIKIKL